MDSLVGYFLVMSVSMLRMYQKATRDGKNMISKAKMMGKNDGSYKELGKERKP